MGPTLDQPCRRPVQRQTMLTVLTQNPLFLNAPLRGTDKVTAQTELPCARKKGGVAATTGRRIFITAYGLPLTQA
jgi:hypothetical protein